MYTMKEKLAHLDKAKAAMENGTGSFHSYAKENGKSSVPRTTSTNSTGIEYPHALTPSFAYSAPPVAV
jgi:hypothetical protein